MNHIKNRVDWCLKKALKEMQEKGKHRGLIKTNPDLNLAKAHIAKAEHLLNGTVYLKKGNFSDISATTLFYSMYHCLLAILAKFGYESGNQECTFALVNNFIEDEKIEFDKDILNKISLLDIKQHVETTTIEVREEYQYGTSLSMDSRLYDRLFELAKDVIMMAKRIIEK